MDGRQRTKRPLPVSGRPAAPERSGEDAGQKVKQGSGSSTAPVFMIHPQIRSFAPQNQVVYCQCTVL